ncbi:hypothetical protein [Streptomyces sp. XD-27]|uniref:hypothetical protein n=1 Tax=Streptomyces sp. XD-27 TaxID=3062779 RepID=UPI0026F40E55|nr:hypothetical protein [Streptomyces sp. XD-27]WKX70264.1 hypothetical protein Q3Y56_10335 [Streptomyces sp. XD-27]
MGVWRTLRRRGARLPVIAAVVVTVGALSACEGDSDRGLSAVRAAYTTDRVATKALEKGGIDVRWMRCTGDAKGEEKRRSGKHTSRPPVREVSVDCEGLAGKKRRADIRVTGTVTFVREGRCVKGDLTGKVAGRQVFHAKVIGDCDKDPDRDNDRRPTKHASYPVRL